jgi:hypothetical protein
LSTKATHKLTCFAAQWKLLELRTKVLYFVHPQLKFLERTNKSNTNCEQTYRTVSCSAAQRKILEFTNKSNSNQLYLFYRADFGIYQRKQLKSTVFCSTALNLHVAFVGTLQIF